MVTGWAPVELLLWHCQIRFAAPLHHHHGLVAGWDFTSKCDYYNWVCVQAGVLLDVRGGERRHASFQLVFPARVPRCAIARLNWARSLRRIHFRAIVRAHCFPSLVAGNRCQVSQKLKTAQDSHPSENTIYECSFFSLQPGFFLTSVHQSIQSRYLQSIDRKSAVPTTTMSSTPSAAAETFIQDIKQTRNAEVLTLSPHPVTGRLIDSHPGVRTQPMQVLVLGESKPKSAIVSNLVDLRRMIRCVSYWDRFHHDRSRATGLQPVPHGQR